ncbi:MAG: cobyrinate a,c-diamide synthase [Rectinemataceae bacterium]
MRLPRLLVGAAASGSGKTSLVVGLLEAFGRRGLDLRPFKAGPDFLDPALHAAVLGRPSRNLDLRLMGAAGTMACLGRAGGGGDLALVEGVMGYYDGEPRSSADLARFVGAPSVLVLDARASAESSAATALGFARYRRRSGIAGFVADRISSERHYDLVRRAVEARTGLPMFGYLPEDQALALPARRLGLVSPEENAGFAAAVRALGDAVSERVDLDALLAAAAAAPELPDPPYPRPASAPAPVRIAVARDEAFSFYYEDNFEILRDLGAELAFFSPLHDSALPEGTSTLYIGGGYPELHLDEIAGNGAMRDSIKSARDAGMPIYAECGGYLYLLEAVETSDGTLRPGLGLAPGVARPGGRLAALGYREGRTLGPSPLGRSGCRLRGHVFHYYRVENGGRASSIELARPGGGERCAEGYLDGRLFASFLHIHFAANPSAARSFVAAARRYARGREADRAR